MTRPALALINTETGEVVQRRLPDDPQAQKLEELSQDNDGLRKANRSLNAELRAVRVELRDVLAEYAPDEEWDEFAAWWIKYTGRTAGTKVDTGVDRCKRYRKLRKRWSRREIATMVVGARNHHFAPFHDRDDMEDFEKSVKWAETCLRIGDVIVPPKEDQA